MARIWLKADTLKITKAGHDPRLATDADAFLFSTDWVADQLVLAGIATFAGASDTTVVVLPPLYASYKLDFFYANVSAGAYAWPDDAWQETDDFIAPTIVTQLHAEVAGGNLFFTRRGQLSGVSNRGVQYWLYASALP